MCVGNACTYEAGKQNMSAAWSALNKSNALAIKEKKSVICGCKNVFH